MDNMSDAALEAIAAVTASEPEPQNNEREQVAEVFGLTGGELMDVAWVPTYPRTVTDYVVDVGYVERVEATPFTFTYWYQGVPDYVESEFDVMLTYRTVCEHEMFGMVPERVTDDEGTWKVVARYRNSGETECPYRAPSYPFPNADNAPAGACPLCEADLMADEPHSSVYIGDGWAEIVYRLQEPPEVHGELAIQEHVSERGQSYVETGIPLTTFTIEADDTERARALRVSCEAGPVTRDSAAAFWLRVWNLLYTADTGKPALFF